MTVADLREILNDPDLPDTLPVRVQVDGLLSPRQWYLDGAHGALAGPDPHLVLELAAVRLAEEDRC